MPNTGKPSRDCHLCRARRVKVSFHRVPLHVPECAQPLGIVPLGWAHVPTPTLADADRLASLQCDLTKPGCLRCTNYGAACPGYREEIDLFFHNENATSVVQRKRKKTDKRQATENVTKPGTSIPRERRSPPGSTRRDQFTAVFAPAPAPNFDLQVSRPPRSHSVSIILDRFASLLQGKKSFGFLDFLPSLFQESPENSCLGLTTELFVKAHMSQISNSTSDEWQIQELYGRTLQSVNSALAHPTESLEDSTMVAVWLLGHYEVKRPPLIRLPTEDMF